VRRGRTGATGRRELAVSGQPILVGGSVAQRSASGGHAWVFLQYLLGFRELGWDPVLVDRLEPEMCFDRHGRSCAPEASVNLAYLREVMERFDLGARYAVLCDGGERCLGMSREALLERARDSALLLNVNGFLSDEDLLARVPLRVYLDIDPGFGQMWKELGLHDPFGGHDAHVTVGENVGLPDCSVPTCGIEWITTPQPVVLSHWPAQPPGGAAFTSVGSWRGPFAPVEYGGARYGLRVHEFRKFVELPARAGQPFEIALDIDPADAPDREALERNGWQVADPKSVAGDPLTYRSYVQVSRAEFMVAKEMYVESRSGWFSDRSICYLASGKPVLAQETGFTRRFPSGEGLLAFSTMEEAIAGVESIVGRPSLHAAQARRLAEEHFDSRKVLTGLLERLSTRPRAAAQSLTQAGRGQPA
jgi:hypothetical protein